MGAVGKVTAIRARAGVQAGDVISMIDNRAVEDAGQFGKLTSDLPKGETVAILIHREGAARFLALKVE
ncbi:MAG: PDZ domain-containing protein [Thiolinea sp.]